MNTPTIWFEIHVENITRARAFYECVLGITLENLKSPDSLDELEMWAFPTAMDRVGAGGALFKAKIPIGEYGHIALVQDTEGKLVGLHSLQ